MEKFIDFHVRNGFSRAFIYILYFFPSFKQTQKRLEATHKKGNFLFLLQLCVVSCKAKRNKKSRNQNKATTIQSHDWWFVSRQNSIHTHNTHTHTCVDEKEPSSYNPSKSNVGRTWKSSFFIIIIIIHFSSAHTQSFFCFNID